MFEVRLERNVNHKIKNAQVNIEHNADISPVCVCDANKWCLNYQTVIVVVALVQQYIISDIKCKESICVWDYGHSPPVQSLAYTVKPILTFYLKEE